MPKCLLAGVVVALSIGAASCRASVSVYVGAGKTDSAGEAQYRALWTKDVTAMRQVEATFGSSCNMGGSQQVCHDASAKEVDAIDQFLSDLPTLRIPSRYAPANATLVRGLTMDRDGLVERNRGFERQDDTAFVAGNNNIKSAGLVLNQAYGQFPPDARPQPPL
jgi:hypothetical protein